MDVTNKQDYRWQVAIDEQQLLTQDKGRETKKVLL